MTSTHGLKISKKTTNVFFSTLNLVIIIIGYQFISALFSPFISAQKSTQLLTLSYRFTTLIISLITIILNLKSKAKVHVVIKVLLVYWLLLLFRFFNDMYFRIDVNVSEAIKIQTIFYMIPMTLLPVYSVIKSYHKINLKKLLSWIYILTSLSLILSFFSNAAFQEASLDRLNLTATLETIGAGHLGLTGLLLSIYLFYKKNKSILYKTLFIFVGSISFIVMLRAGSRGPLLALIGIVLIWILGVSKRKVLNIFLMLITVGLGYLLLDHLMEIINYFSPALYNRFTNQASSQLDSRNSLYIIAVNTFLQNPILGRNFAIYLSNGQMIYAHNIFLDSIMQLGIIGGVMIVYIIWKSILKIINLINIRSSYFWIGLLLMQEIMKLMVSNSIYRSPLFTILIVLIFMPLDNNNYSLTKYSIRKDYN